MRSLVLFLSFSFLFSLFLGCSEAGKGADVTQKGFLVSISPVLRAADLPSDLNVQILGRSQDGIEFKRKDLDPTGNALEFELSKVPNEETLVPIVSGSGLEPIVSFPLIAGSSEPWELAAAETGTFANFLSNAVNQGLLSPGEVNLNSSASVYGIVAPAGDCGQSVSGISFRDLDGSPVPNIKGPFYFNTSGQVVSGGMQDSQCRYLVFNIPQGVYRIEYIGLSSVVAKVVAQTGQKIVGYNIP